MREWGVDLTEEDQKVKPFPLAQRFIWNGGTGDDEWYIDMKERWREEHFPKRWYTKALEWVWGSLLTSKSQALATFSRMVMGASSIRIIRARHLSESVRYFLAEENQKGQNSD